MRLLRISTLILALLLLGGCALLTPKSSGGKPAWVLNPNQGGKVGAVGVAGKTYDQRLSTQRKLAITRALDELAMQQGVEVSLSMTKQEHLSNNKASTSMDVDSRYKTSNDSAITAHIEAIWKDPYTNELYVWLVLDR